MSQLNFAHQKHLFNPNAARPVTLIGAGSVGSKVARELAKLGCTKITVWDGDDEGVMSHNVPMSAYGAGDISRPKVEALREIILSESRVEITAVAKMWTGGKLRDSVIACVDTMEARMAIWAAVKNRPMVDVFIDTRIAGEYIEVYRTNPCDPKEIANYEKVLFPSEDAMRPTCGNHGITYVSTLTAGAAVSRLTATWKGRKTDQLFRFLAGALESV